MFLVKLILFSSTGWSSTSLPSSLPQNEVKSFRSWIATIVEDQISRGVNPRWTHRDCAGLVRFAVSESLAKHNEGWRKANGFIGRPLPAEVEMTNAQREAFKIWKNSDGEKSHFVRALPLIQENAVFLGKTSERLERGDLLFFDQGDEQHLMIWTGTRLVYHNGHQRQPRDKSKDNGLRTVSLNELMNWKDSRWQPRVENPNFIGFYRLTFLNSQNQQGVL